MDLAGDGEVRPVAYSARADRWRRKQGEEEVRAWGVAARGFTAWGKVNPAMNVSI